MYKIFIREKDADMNFRKTHNKIKNNFAIGFID